MVPVNDSETRRPPGWSVEDGPAVRAVDFERAKARLVVHLVATVDPVAEIEVGQRPGAGLVHKAQDHVAARTVLDAARLVEGIDRREPVGDDIEHAYAVKAPLGCAELGKARVYGAFLDEVGVTVAPHPRHGAVGVAGR